MGRKGRETERWSGVEGQGRYSERETDRQRKRGGGKGGRQRDGAGGEGARKIFSRERIFNALNSAKIRNRNAQHNNVFTCFPNAVKDRLHLISAPLNLLWCENPSLILTIATCCHVVFNTMEEACVGKEFAAHTHTHIHTHTHKAKREGQRKR